MLHEPENLAGLRLINGDKFGGGYAKIVNEKEAFFNEIIKGSYQIRYDPFIMSKYGLLPYFTGLNFQVS